MKGGVHEIGVTISLGRYRATVHYAGCTYYNGRQSHETLEVPPTIRWKLCSFCRPTPEDIAAVAREIRWIVKREDMMGDNSRRVSWNEVSDKDIARQGIYGGRTLRKRRPEEG